MVSSGARYSGSSIAMVLVVGLLWGLNWPAVKIMIAEIQPFTIRAVAFPCAALLLAIYARWKGESLVPTRAEWLPLLITATFLIFAFNMLTSLGQSLTEASRAVIIAYTMPAITALFSAVYLKERLSRQTLMALVLGMLGLAVLVSGDVADLISNPAGSLVMLLAAMVWSIGNVSLKACSWQLAPAALAAWCFAISMVLSWPVLLIFEPPSAFVLPSVPVLLTLAFHIVGPMVICYVLWNNLIKRLPLSVAAISILTAPVVGVVTSVLFIGEALTWQKSVSLILIVASIAITMRQAPAR